jgi:uncharacterized protein
LSDIEPSPPRHQGGQDAASAGLAVPWTARQTVIGACLTLAPLVLLVVSAQLAVPRPTSAAAPLTTRQDWAQATLLVISQTVVEGVFLLAPLYYALKCRPEGSALTVALGTLGFRKFNVRQAALLLAAGLVAVLVLGQIYSLFHVRTNADTLLQQAATAPVSTIATLVVAVTVAPLCEETFFRGYLFPGLARVMSPWAAVVVSALIFGVAHADAGSFALLFILGLVLALLRWRTGSLWPGIVFHAFNNGIVLVYVVASLHH